MKSYSLFGVVGVSIAAMAAFGGCTVTTINNGGTDGGDDANGGSSSGSSDDSSTEASSSSSGSSSGASSGSSSGASEASSDAPACAAMSSFAPQACDDCMKSMCCTPLVACETPNDAGSADGGSGCYDAFTCTLSYVATYPDSGLDDAVTGCTGSTSTADQGLLTSLLTCATTSCGSACN
jgi:hypothetical protein